jgi:cell division protease FtsH
VHTRTVTLAPDVELDTVAASTPGFAGADLANLVNEAALAAARAGKPAVTGADFETAIDRVVAGLERKSRVMTPQEKKIVAHHEAGHALLAELRPTGDRVARVSIIPRGAASLGHTRQQPTDDRYVLTRTELLDRLDVMLGGRVAEEIALGEISTGAFDDLQRASELARDMVTRFGMSDELGIVSCEGPRRAPYTDVLLPERREFSEGTSREIDRQVRKLLDDARARDYETLMKNRRALDAIAQELVAREVIDRERLRALLASPAAAAA